MKKAVCLGIIVIFVAFFLFLTGCSTTSDTANEPVVNETITLAPGASQVYSVPWMGTYTDINVSSNLPIDIQCEDNQSLNKSNTTSFTLQKKLYMDYKITIKNPNQQKATVLVKITTVKVYESFK